MSTFWVNFRGENSNWWDWLLWQYFFGRNVRTWCEKGEGGSFFLTFCYEKFQNKKVERMIEWAPRYLPPSFKNYQFIANLCLFLPTSFTFWLFEAYTFNLYILENEFVKCKDSLKIITTTITTHKKMNNFLTQNTLSVVQFL